MSELIPFSAPGNNVPAHLSALFGDAENITQRSSINQLSYRGKVWRRVVDGEETQLTRKNSDGDTEPVPIVSMVILDHNKSRSRAFYSGNFEEGKNAAPVCFSADGISPDTGVKEPCAASCAACPNSVKGSKITENGKQSTACSPFKRIAVVPSQALGKHPVMLLRLAQTSIWDKDNNENEAKGWYAWDQYVDMLRARGAKHTAAVETKIKFDLRQAYPKLLFSAARWLDAEEAGKAKARLTESKDEITAILTGGNADGVMGSPEISGAPPEDAEESALLSAAKLAAEKKAAAKKAAAKIAADNLAAAKIAADNLAAAKIAADNLAAAKVANEPEDDSGESWGDVEAAPVVEPAKPKPAAKATGVAVPAPAVLEDTPSGLADLLSGWDA